MPFLRQRWPVALLVMAAWPGSAAHAYEGAGILRAQPSADGGVAQLTKPPELKKFVEAPFPAEALAAGSQGAAVGLLIDLDAEGRVTAAEVSQSGGEAFDAAARAALLQFEFSPAELDGQPAAVRIEYVYHFEVRPPPEPPPAEKPVNLTGQVLRRGTREILGGANVYLPEHELSAETNAEGYFEIRDVPVGKVKVAISMPGHQKYEVAVEIKPGQVSELTAYLFKSIGGTFETVVHGDRERQEVSQRSLRKDELTSVPGTFGDPLRVLEDMPGMGRPPLMIGMLLVRGAQPQDSTVLFDGVPVPLLYHSYGGPSVVSPSFIDQIDFLPGAYGARYGRSLAGVVDVTTKPPEPTDYHGTVKFDAQDLGFYVEGPLGKDRKYGSFAAAARRSYIDIMLPLVAETGLYGDTYTVAPYYWDYQARYVLDLGKSRLELSGFGAEDQLSLVQHGDLETQPFNLDMNQAFQRVQLRWTRSPEDGWSFSFAPSFGWTGTHFTATSYMNVDSGAWDVRVRGAAKKEISSSLKLEAGIDTVTTFFTLKFISNQEAAAGQEAPPPLVSEHPVRTSAYAGYLEAVWSPVERWKVVPGLRFELFGLPAGLAPVLEPRLATQIRLTDSVTAKAAWGLYHQAPMAVELTTGFGNPDLRLQQSQQSVLGLEVRPLPSLLPQLLLDVQGFFNWRTDLVATSTRYVERDGQQVAERLGNSGHGRAYGLEVLLKHDLTERLFGWIAYTLTRSEQWDPDAGAYLATAFDQSHILTVVASYRLFDSWQVGTRFQLTTGRPETPVVDSTFEADNGTYLPVYGATGSARGSTFHQLDLRVEKIITFPTWKASVFFDVRNVYNSANPELTMWDYRYRQSAPLRGMPFWPAVGGSGTF
ncbi:MAG: TonB-dependent receptor [Deltaproteobacteria bacterium]|nr:TonB-dependent receptor [Deltaproteobacteria bacterium]